MSIPNLSSISNIARLWSKTGARRKAYSFDWSTGYIACDTVLGRTGYDLNVAGNVSTGSDADGSYFGFTLTPASVLVSDTAVPNISLSLAHSVAVKIKTGSDVTTSQTVFNNIVSSSNRVTITVTWWELRAWIWNGTSYVGKKSFPVSANTTYVIHYTWNGSSVGKIYSSAVESTTVPAWDPSASWAVGVSLSRSWTGFGWFIYRCACRNAELSQAEVTADYNLWNTTKSDSRIVAYYIPENLQYNTQYASNPTNFTQSSRTKWANTTITASYATRADWRVAQRVVWTWVWWLSANKCDTTFTSLTGSVLASKTFIVKAFVRAVSGTQTFRLRCTHSGVADYYSSDLTATSVPQEFTFTQAFTSSTAWTWVTAWLVTSAVASATDLEVVSIKVWVTNETLRDESPNIGWFIGWKTNKVFSCRYKPNADFADTATAWPIMIWPWLYLHDRGSNHSINIRYSQRLAVARVSTVALWAWFRGRVHIIGCFFWNGSSFETRLYANWILQDSDTNTLDAPTNIQNSGNFWLWRMSTDRTQSYIRDPRIYTFTWSFTDAHAATIYNWQDPVWFTRYLRWRPSIGESGATTIDRTGNNRTGTLTGWTTRVNI